MEFKCLLRSSSKVIHSHLQNWGLTNWAHHLTRKRAWPEGLSYRIQIQRCSKGHNFLVTSVGERIFCATTLNLTVCTVLVGPHWGFNEASGKAPTDGVWPLATSAPEVILLHIICRKRKVSNLSSFDTDNFSYLCQMDEVCPVSSVQKFLKGWTIEQYNRVLVRDHTSDFPNLFPVVLHSPNIWQIYRSGFSKALSTLPPC